MNNYGELIDQNTLQFQRVLPGNIERVWDYIVDPDLRRKWFAGGPVDLTPGGTMELHFDHAKFTDSDDPILEKFKSMEKGSMSRAIVLKSEKPSLFVINWEDGIVTFKLDQIEESQVLLTLTHERLKDSKDYRMGVLAGWHTHLDILVDIISGNEPKGFWKVYVPLEEEYAKGL